MIYHRRTKGSYRAWAEKVGDEGYEWEQMEKYLKQSMRFSKNEAKRALNATPAENLESYSAEGGPLSVAYQSYVQPLSYYAGKAFDSVGIPRLPGDFSTGRLIGHGWWPFTIDPETGLRSSAEATFLAEAFGREGLTTYVNAHVNNIIFNGTNTAMGVNVTGNGQRPYTLKSRKEVIVSAGAYHSPQLLMVSGIGPRETLEMFEIPVVKDLPGVGQNMWDTCNIGGPVYEISVSGFSTWQQPEQIEYAQKLLLANGTGPLTNIGVDYVAFSKLPNASRARLTPEARTALAKFPADWPEIENSLSSSSRTLTVSDSKKQYGSIGNLLVATTSRGNMTIRSASNFDAPVISPNWLLDSTDQQVAIESYKLTRQAWLAVLEGIRVREEFFPGKNVTMDAQLLEAIMGNISPIHHASSCAMGKADDPMAVVDAQARVYGVQRLSVIDSSSFPFTPPGHAQGVTYAHAEKLVDDILNEHEAS